MRGSAVTLPLSCDSTRHAPPQLKQKTNHQAAVHPEQIGMLCADEVVPSYALTAASPAAGRLCVAADVWVLCLVQPRWPVDSKQGLLCLQEQQRQVGTRHVLDTAYHTMPRQARCQSRRPTTPQFAAGCRHVHRQAGRADACSVTMPTAGAVLPAGKTPLHRKGHRTQW